LFCDKKRCCVCVCVESEKKKRKKFSHHRITHHDDFFSITFQSSSEGKSDALRRVLERVEMHILTPIKLSRALLRRRSSGVSSSGPANLQQDRSPNPRNQEFYAREGGERRYYYVLDTRGQVFLEETRPRTIATSMKDVKFLNFIHSSLQLNSTGQNLEYPFVSYCGREINFISPMDRLSAFVFRDFSRSLDKKHELIYGGNLSHPFSVESLMYRPETGRLYHRILQHKYLAGHYALLHPSLCELLSQGISSAGDNAFVLTWDGRAATLPTEPGS
jgi:hypothetical protein